jgi:ABC-2 type transport system permease protein
MDRPPLHPTLHLIAGFFAQMRLSLAQALQFRSNYALTVLSVATGAGVEVALWRLVLQSRGQVKGFGLEELIIYLVISNVTSMMCVNWGNVLQFSQEVRSGRIARHLLKPLPLFLVATADWIGDKIPIFIGAVPVFWGISYFWPTIFHPGVQETSMFFAGLCISLWLSAEIYFIITLSAFWIAENSGVAIAFNLLRWAFVGMAFPLSFYPKWLTDVLDATPLPYIVYYPTLAFMGRLSIQVFAMKLVFALLIAVATSLLRRVLMHMAEHRLQTVGG